MIGLSVGGGFPEGSAASLLFRPLLSIRFFGGPTWGYYAWGMHGGVVLAPWNGWITPTLSFEAGQLFRSNLSSLAKGGDSGTSQAMRSLLSRIDYRYVAGDLGLELGSPGGLAFFLRFGLSFVTVKANGSATYTNDNGTRVTITDPVIRATLPSTKLGLQYWF